MSTNELILASIIVIAVCVTMCYNVTPNLKLMRGNVSFYMKDRDVIKVNDVSRMHVGESPNAEKGFDLYSVYVTLNNDRMVILNCGDEEDALETMEEIFEILNKL